MANAPLTTQQLQEVMDALARAGQNQSHAAEALGMPRLRFVHRMREAVRRGVVASAGATAPRAAMESPPPEQLAADLRDRIRVLETQLKAHADATLDEEYVKRKIIGLAALEVEPPAWLVRSGAAGGHQDSVPTLFASDWHWGEVVDPAQINGKNRFNLEIANERARALIETTIDLLENHIRHDNYPGIVFALGGDMVSGDIHDELSATNEMEIMPCAIELWGVLAWCIEQLANKFGRVFVPCVTGNHGRNTHKIRAKGRNFTSFDWLVYQFLAKRFEADERVHFQIPAGPDALYSVYGHRYLLTHGDQFRGGDGMIGALGPIIRGDHKKRSRNAQIDMAYDTMMLGHWHQYIQLQRLIVNGSLKGYDEYAYSNGFGFEPPRQALWLTHPDRGVTFSAPVLVDRPAARRRAPTSSWVSWQEAA